jgi:hypothetical protein
MIDNPRVFLPLTAIIGAVLALFSTFLPWYSFQVILPVARVVHIFSVTTTLWGFTTLAPILIIAGAVVALLVAGLASPPISDAVVGLIGLAFFVYGIVRCFAVPNLGVELLPGGVPAVTQLEGGPFVELVGGLMLVLGALGDLLAAPADATYAGPRRWRGGRSTPAPPHAAT